MPFAYHPGPVSCPFEQFGNGFLLRIQSHGAAGKQCAVNTHWVGIASGEQCGAGSAANRLAGIEVGKPHSFRRQAIQMGSLVGTASVADRVAIPHVIHVNSEHMWGRGSLHADSGDTYENGAENGQQSQPKPVLNEDYMHKLIFYPPSGRATHRSGMDWRGDQRNYTDSI